MKHVMEWSRNFHRVFFNILISISIGSRFIFDVSIEKGMMSWFLHYARFLEATVMGLDAKQPASVRISAIRSVYEYCDHLKATNGTQMILPYMTQIMEGILTLATQFSADVLALVMETLQVVLAVSIVVA